VGPSAELQLALCVLSFRVKKSGSAGDQLKEAQAINKSLSALGDVISALATEQAHVPYRNHKLTMLMSDSIGGTAKTLMFVNVSPSDNNLDETQNSLTVRGCSCSHLWGRSTGVCEACGRCTGWLAGWPSPLLCTRLASTDKVPHTCPAACSMPRACAPSRTRCRRTRTARRCSS
jgi:hypothetical protein